MITEATKDNIPHLLYFSQREAIHHNLPYDPTQAHVNFHKALVTPGYIVLISAKGFLVGCVQNCLFSKEKYGRVDYWYDENNEGVELLKHFNALALKQGATVLTCHVTTGKRGKAFDRYMGALGYTPIERIYARGCGDSDSVGASDGVQCGVGGAGRESGEQASGHRGASGQRSDGASAGDSGHQPGPSAAVFEPGFTDYTRSDESLGVADRGRSENWAGAERS